VASGILPLGPFLSYISTPQSDIYLFGDANGKPTHLVAWQPVVGTDKSLQLVTINRNNLNVGQLQTIILDGKSAFGSPTTTLPTVKGDKIEVYIGATPTVIALNGTIQRYAAAPTPSSGIELLEPVCTDGELNLKVPLTERAPVVYTIIDKLGNHVRHGHIHDNHAHLDGLGAGTYLLKIHNFGLPTPMLKFIVP
jgi:hypothetical protein